MSQLRGAEKFIQDVVREAGDAVMKRFGKDGVHYTKSDRIWDVVTKSDILSEKIIISRIQKKYPEHSIISEERGDVNEGAEYVWIIDPIDGTLNYSRGVPAFGVMVCLVRSGEVVLSAINMPATKELFFAQAGKGTYCNGKRVRCSEEKRLPNSFGTGSTSMSERSARFLTNLIREGDGTHMMYGSFASMANNACYAASGKRDWIVALNGNIWDFAPAYLMLKEAGCKVTDTKGKQWRFGMLEFVAANSALHKQLLKLTKNI
ncbi:MAG: inositol monophosphatase [bacterium]|nr:inositol monophosphatase [bacterium]